MPPDRTFWLVPRRWVVALAALIVTPWLITGAAFFARGGRDVPDEPGSATPASVADPADPHPWGRLLATPIVISPPLEYVPSNWGPIERPAWRLPGMDRQELQAFLTWTGLEDRQVADVIATAREEPGTRGLIVTPDPRLVHSLAPETRARLYVQLAKYPGNGRQYEAYRFAGGSPDEWLGGAPVSASTRQLIEPLIYRADGFMYFADIDLVRTGIESAGELQLVAKRLLRSATLLVELQVEPGEVEAAAEYWGRGGRRTDIRPLLESIAAGPADRTIDISHLLPVLAREHLYRYPQISLQDLQKPSLPNCFWTALNFFNQTADDRYLDAAFAIEQLKRDYYIVHDGLQLGDIAAFAGADGDYFHAAVYLADGLLFGKNGTSSLSPWTIVPMEQLKGYYIERADDWNVTYYRHKSF